MAIQLIAESGSSKTGWLLTDRVAQQNTYRETCGLNPYFHTPLTLREAIEEACTPLVRPKITDVFFYGAGCGSAENQDVMREVLGSVFPAAHTIAVADDLTAALRATCGTQPGLVGILGTGAGAGWGEGGHLKRQRLGNGIWLGDEGSGGYLGKMLVKSYLDDELPPALRQAYEQTFPYRRAELLQKVYREAQPSRFLASFAPFLKQQLAHPFVGQLVRDAFRLFFEKSLLPLAVRENTCYFVGSIAYYFQEILAEVAAEKHFQLGTIVQRPLDALGAYHS